MLWDILVVVWVVGLVWALYHFVGAIGDVIEYRHPTREPQAGDD